MLARYAPHEAQEYEFAFAGFAQGHGAGLCPLVQGLTGASHALHASGESAAYFGDGAQALLCAAQVVLAKATVRR